MRLAVDQIDLIGVRALEKRGASLVDAWALMEEARVVKSSEEIAAIKTDRQRDAIGSFVAPTGWEEATGYSGEFGDSFCLAPRTTPPRS